MSQLPASSRFNRERASSRVKNAVWTLALSALLGCAGVLAMAQTAPTALEAELADYIEMPRTTTSDGRSQAARVNVLIEEPGNGRLFVAEHGGPLSIIDKKTRQAVTYINFNGSAGAPGLFPKFAPTGGFVSGLMGFTFDPDYRRNGVFYTLHLENPATDAPAAPKAGVLAGLDASRFVVTKPIEMPANGQPLTREGVISEWTDSNIRNATFEGTVREVMRVQLLNAIHPMSDMTFNPTARQGDAEWRVLYVSTGDGGTGETADVRRLNPQRLDHFGGTIIRIVPDVREHVSTSQVSENGQYRIPNDNPFVSTPGARKEIFAYGMRNPHRMAWDVPAGPGSQARLLAFVIGSNMGSPVRYETINIIRRGANYGYPLREGPEFKPESPIYGPLSADNTLPLRISDTVVLDRRVPMQDSALAYRTGVEGLAIANGFVYRGKRWPATSGRRRLWRHHERKIVLREDGRSRCRHGRQSHHAGAVCRDQDEPSFPCPGAHQGKCACGWTGCAGTGGRPGPGPAAPGRPLRRHRPRRAAAGPPAGRAGGPFSGPRPLRVEVRIATDEAGEIYILTKSDGLVRRVTSIR